MPHRIRRIAVAAALLVAVCGCGAAGSPARAPARTPGLSGHLLVLAAASLTEAFGDAEGVLEREHPGFSATYSFAGSQQLVTNVRDGAPADVIATANLQTMDELTAAGLVGTPQVFARNMLEIAVAPGNPKHITGLRDLARSDLSVVLADPSVPAGSFAAEALARAGVHVAPRSLELDVKSVLRKVADGDADAGIVYATDVTAAGASVQGVAIPAAQNVVAVYPIAVVRASAHPQAAAALVAEAVSGVLQRALRQRGFLPP